MNIKRRLQNYFAQGKLPAKQGICCISLLSQEFIFIYAYLLDGKLTIGLYGVYSYKDTNDFVSQLGEIVKANNLKNVPCSLILSSDDYQLVIVDALPVSKSEFQAAIRFKIKDLIRYPLNDIIIDSFDLPQMKNNAKKIMVVVSKASKLEELRNQIKQAGLNLKWIDISELALRNIAVLHEKNTETSAFIYVQENSIQLLFIAAGQIYISRLLMINLNNQDQNVLLQSMERFANEIKRSIDYFQNLWNLPIPSYFLFTSVKAIPPEATELLSQRVKVPIKMITIENFIACKSKIDLPDQGKYWLVIGEALKEQAQHATGN